MSTAAAAPRVQHDLESAAPSELHDQAAQLVESRSQRRALRRLVRPGQCALFAQAAAVHRRGRVQQEGGEPDARHLEVWPPGRDAPQPSRWRQEVHPGWASSPSPASRACTS